MTEKRFKINTLETGHIYIDNLNGEHMSWIEVEETLNNLYNKNEQLKQELDQCKSVIDKRWGEYVEKEMNE